jgi:hypothetical protein
MLLWGHPPRFVGEEWAQQWPGWEQLTPALSGCPCRARSHAEGFPSATSSNSDHSSMKWVLLSLIFHRPGKWDKESSSNLPRAMYGVYKSWTWRICPPLVYPSTSVGHLCVKRGLALSIRCLPCLSHLAPWFVHPINIYWVASKLPAESNIDMASALLSSSGRGRNRQ